MALVQPRGLLRVRRRRSLDQLAEQLGFPFVLKPARQGSSLGIKFVEAPEQFGPAIVGALGYDDRVLIERYVSGGSSR